MGWGDPGGISDSDGGLWAWRLVPARDACGEEGSVGSPEWPLAHRGRKTRPRKGRGAGLGMRTPALKFPEHQHSRAKGPQGNRGAPRSGFKWEPCQQPAYIQGRGGCVGLRRSPRFPGLLQGVQQGRTPQAESEDPDINPALCREGLVRTEVAGSTRHRRS